MSVEPDSRLQRWVSNVSQNDLGTTARKHLQPHDLKSLGNPVSAAHLYTSGSQPVCATTFSIALTMAFLTTTLPFESGNTRYDPYFDASTTRNCLQRAQILHKDTERAQCFAQVGAQAPPLSLARFRFGVSFADRQRPHDDRLTLRRPRERRPRSPRPSRFLSPPTNCRGGATSALHTSSPRSTRLPF